MIIELLCRYHQEDSNVIKDIDLELETRSIIEGDSFDRASAKRKLMIEHKAYEYGPFVFKLNDVKSFNYADADHTTISFYGGETRVFKMEYSMFKSVYAGITSLLIHDFTNTTNIKELTNGTKG